MLVTDGRKPVAGLSASDFEVRDSGVVQSVQVVDAADVPLNVVLALDVSGSASGSRREDLVAASQVLLDGLHADDRVALTTFSHAVLPRVELTGDFAAIRRELLKASPAGRTSILDAVYVALTGTLAQPGRSLVVVCTDGSDISSWLTIDEVVESANRSNAVIYAVTASDTRRVGPLEELARVTGGEVLRARAGADLRAALGRILRDFRSRYVLAYTPTGVQSGGFHRLDVRVKRRGLTVQARPGYVGSGDVR